MFLVLASDQTIALHNGFFDSESKHTTVYLWLQSPSPSICYVLNPYPNLEFCLFITVLMTDSTECKIYDGLCSSHPYLSLICLWVSIYWSTSVPSNKNSENLVVVVDWSSEARYFF
jgi:hypothetical protein